MPPGPAGPGFSFSGNSVTNASVVSIRAEIEAAFCSAVRVTLVGSTTPAFTRSSYLPVATLNPFIAAALLDFLDDQSAFLASVVGELACRKLECAANDFRTNSLI